MARIPADREPRGDTGALTHSQLRRLLGFATRDEADGFLEQHQVYLEYTLEDLEQDLENSRSAHRSSSSPTRTGLMHGLLELDRQRRRRS